MRSLVDLGMKVLYEQLYAYAGVAEWHLSRMPSLPWWMNLTTISNSTVIYRQYHNVNNYCTIFYTRICLPWIWWVTSFCSSWLWSLLWLKISTNFLELVAKQMLEKSEKLSRNWHWKNIQIRTRSVHWISILLCISLFKSRIDFNAKCIISPCTMLPLRPSGVICILFWLVHCCHSICSMFIIMFLHNAELKLMHVNRFLMLAVYWLQFITCIPFFMYAVHVLYISKPSVWWHKFQDDPDANELFVRINRAYEVLKDEDLRKKYDKFGEDGLKEDGPSGQGFQSWKFYQQDFGRYILITYRVRQVKWPPNSNIAGVSLIIRRFLWNLYMLFTVLFHE